MRLERIRFLFESRPAHTVAFERVPMRLGDLMEAKWRSNTVWLSQ